MVCGGLGGEGVGCSALQQNLVMIVLTGNYARSIFSSLSYYLITSRCPGSCSQGYATLAYSSITYMELLFN